MRSKENRSRYLGRPRLESDLTEAERVEIGRPIPPAEPSGRVGGSVWSPRCLMARIASSAVPRGDHADMVETPDVIPAKAGIQGNRRHSRPSLDPRLRGNE
jgi:hypothetical protein